MVGIKKIIFLIFSAPLLGNAQLTKFAEEWKTDKDLKNGSIGFCVMDAKTSQVLSELNSHQLLIPASTLKVVTTSAALGILGANFQYQTKLYFTGDFNKQTGILNGNLIIEGSGDPTLQSENFSKESITDKWAKILKEKGLKEIKGKIIGDASFFERGILGNWIWADISNYFGATPCGLSYKDNKFKMIYNTKETGSKAKLVTTTPNYLTLAYFIQSDVTAKGTEDEAYVYGDPYSFQKEVKGTLPPNKANYEVEAALPNPALLCAEALYASLSASGIVCNKKLIESNYKKQDSIIKKQLVYTHFSPSLEKIIFYTNTKSNNHYCESILSTLGKGKIQTGIEVVKNYWESRGLNMDELYMTDGSGLSRANTITTSFQTLLLCKAYRDSSIYKSFKASLPIAGKSGSMSNIGKGSFIENNMQAKTGDINRARGYCGYLKPKSGKNLCFSVLFNNYNCSAHEAKLKIEKFLIELGEL